MPCQLATMNGSVLTSASCSCVCYLAAVANFCPLKLLCTDRENLKTECEERAVSYPMITLLLSAAEILKLVCLCMCLHVFMCVCMCVCYLCCHRRKQNSKIMLLILTSCLLRFLLQQEKCLILSTFPFNFTFSRTFFLHAQHFWASRTVWMVMMLNLFVG